MYVDKVSDQKTWNRLGSVWPSSEKRSLVCVSVTAETADVKTFGLCTEDGSLISFEPGQFITVDVDTGVEKVSRCYTISSPPTRPFSLSITVKRVANGEVSNWLHDHLSVGDRLNAYGPSGAFTTTVAQAEKLLFLSAGSGVTPLMSMVRAASDLAVDRDVVFVHSARTPEDIIFRNEICHLSKRLPRLKVLNVVEGVGKEPEWNGQVGRLNLEMLKSYVPDFADREVFICGPGGYMSSIKDTLAHEGFDMSRYHSENFDLSAETPDARGPDQQQELSGADGGGAELAIRLARAGMTFYAWPGETVLAAAKRAGVAIASSCSQGICGTCIARLLEGTVDMQHAGGIRQREIDKGLRLLCCSTPTSDLVLDL